MAKLNPEEVQSRIDAVRPRLTERHAALLEELTPEDGVSMANNVTPENIEVIQGWIGTDEEIETMLFWDKGGKFDDPEWQGLEPADDASRSLYETAQGRFKRLRGESVRNHRRADLALHSQFNEALLYTGLAPAVRCNSDGAPDPAGGRFRGIEWRLLGSVEDMIHSITILPQDGSDFEVHFGERADDAASGVPVYTGDSYAITQVEYFVKGLKKLDYEVALRDSSGSDVTLPKGREIRRKAMKGEDLGVPPELILYAFKHA